MDVGAGTDSLRVDGGNLMKSSCKSPDVFPGIVSMCEANTIHVQVINCQVTIYTVGFECIWWPLLVANDLTTHMCVSYAMEVEGGRGATSCTYVHCTESLWSGEQFQSCRTCVATVGHVESGHSHPVSCDPPTGPAHVTVHVNRRVTCAPEPVVARGSSGVELLYLLAGGSRVAGGASKEIQGHDSLNVGITFVQLGHNRGD